MSKIVYFQKNCCPYCGSLGLDGRQNCINCGAPQGDNVTHNTVKDEIHLIEDTRPIYYGHYGPVSSDGYVASCSTCDAFDIGVQYAPVFSRRRF